MLTLNHRPPTHCPDDQPLPCGCDAPSRLSVQWQGALSLPGLLMPFISQGATYVLAYLSTAGRVITSALDTARPGLTIVYNGPLAGGPWTQLMPIVLGEEQTPAFLGYDDASGHARVYTVASPEQAPLALAASTLPSGLAGLLPLAPDSSGAPIFMGIAPDGDGACYRIDPSSGAIAAVPGSGFSWAGDWQSFLPFRLTEQLYVLLASTADGAFAVYRVTQGDATIQASRTAYGHMMDLPRKSTPFMVMDSTSSQTYLLANNAGGAGDLLTYAINAVWPTPQAPGIQSQDWGNWSELAVLSASPSMNRVLASKSSAGKVSIYGIIPPSC